MSSLPRWEFTRGGHIGGRVDGMGWHGTSLDVVPMMITIVLMFRSNTLQEVAEGKRVLAAEQGRAAGVRGGG